jgi:hypothetical protein
MFERLSVNFLGVCRTYESNTDKVNAPIKVPMGQAVDHSIHYR